MRRVFIGHRGVGKSALLKRHKNYFPDVAHFDLDHEIESQSGKNISDLFTEIGESEFRRLEKRTFGDLILKNSEFVICLGAGFSVHFIEPDCEVIYLSRATDADGRIFLNRPRLERQMSYLEEYKKRYLEREVSFLNRSQFIYHLPEGIDEFQTHPIEEAILKRNFKIEDAIYTLTANEISIIKQLMTLFSSIELRTDLISKNEIEKLTLENPNFNWLVSYRTDIRLSLPTNVRIDRDVEYFSNQQADVLSTHASSIGRGIKQLESTVGDFRILKLCPLIENFSDLEIGYRWQQQAPMRRSFLPRSTSGKWLWFRQSAKYFQPLNFVRSYAGILDQPSIFQWLQLPATRPLKWGAVLGHPVYFSRSPMIHESAVGFFTHIDIEEREWLSAIQLVRDMGLSYAAVTSPLKKKAFEIANTKSEQAIKYQAVNTLCINNEKIAGHNTDATGFRNLVNHIEADKSVLVWGGGGTLEMMKNFLPHAHFASARTGELKNGELKHAYDYLIWAAPRATETIFPDEKIHFKKIIDLNYRENSMGLELAAIRKISYVSGIQMFHAQAREQKKYWSNYECK